MLNKLLIGNPKPEEPQPNNLEKNQPGQAQNPINEKPETVSSPVSSTDAPPEWASDLGVERGTPEQAEAEAQGVQYASEFLDKESWHKVFCAGFCAASSMTGFQSLHVDETDGRAIGCTDALYETFLEIPALHFLLKPPGKWAARAFAIGAFTLPMAKGVQMEIAERRAVQEAREKEAEGYAPKEQEEQAVSKQKFVVPDFDRTGKNEAV